jgi:pSer/pThr/pTyr-binding forkhead associated (FHA) protein
MTETHVFTKTDPVGHTWTLDDDVLRLRPWATDTHYVLPEPPVDECTIGAADTCSLRLEDPSGRVSRLHACMVRDSKKWILQDTGSKNGIRVDGARRSDVILAPGLEIGIGGLTLVAESALSIALHRFLSRLLGWSSERMESVDQALRSVRMAGTRRSALVLCGAGDLVPVAQSIHRHVRGKGQPFIVCDPKRQAGNATVRSAQNYTTGRPALRAAAGGTICMRSQRLPPDFRDVMDALRAPDSQVQLMICAETPEDCERSRVAPIVIPPLLSRMTEVDQIIDEYAAEAMDELMIPRSTFRAADHAWVREHESTSLPAIEKAALRLVALRASRTLSGAATRLRMAPVSLSRWIGRRRLPMEIGE